MTSSCAGAAEGSGPAAAGSGAPAGSEEGAAAVGVGSAAGAGATAGSSAAGATPDRSRTNATTWFSVG